MKVADQTYYLNADRSEVLPAKPQPKKLVEGEVFDETPDGAAYLLVRAGSEVTAEMAAYGIEGVEQEEAKTEPGIVTTSEGPEGRQGFIPASDAQSAGVVVTGENVAEESVQDVEKVSRKASKSAKKGK